jgi:hypothetical protein
MTDEIQTMRLRELGGCITRAREVYIYVPYAMTTTPAEAGTEGEGGEPETEIHGVYLQCSKERARFIIDEAREKGIEEVVAHWDGGVGKNLMIGDYF